MKRIISTLASVGIAILLSAGNVLAEDAKTNAPVATTEAEAKYTKAIEGRTADILAVLALTNAATAASVHDILIAQYRGLRDWHDANDVPLRQASKTDTNQAAQIKATLKTLHDGFITKLSAQLTPAQVEQVKDKMTYNKVPITYAAYCEIIPTLTDAQKARILEILKDAREEAMDGGSSGEKDAVFRRYKGRIANYLSKEGVDEAGARKAWNAKQKSKEAGAVTNQPAQ